VTEGVGYTRGLWSEAPTLSLSRIVSQTSTLLILRSELVEERIG
jgi:hypothetical protein